ncbi:hypothetical protein MPSEU_000864600 [Mayamaea pseudoterrestris]|nr:hypothetical protein MPSEU_000864600 [Mayamaea pseudoterrestris]
MLAQRRSLLASASRSFAAFQHCSRTIHTSLNTSKLPQPTLEMAHSMPLTPQELDNHTLITMSALGNLNARKEIVKRHIMSVDRIEYEEAVDKFELIEATNLDFQLLYALPYKIGIAIALTAGFTSFPLVFHLPTAEFFNNAYVTADVPEPKDIETALEVAGWTWNWMEPLLGQSTFFLLCLQFSRIQIEMLGFRPYTEYIKSRRAKRLAKSFPQYDAGVLMGFSKAVPLFDSKRKLL